MAQLRDGGADAVAPRRRMQILSEPAHRVTLTDNLVAGEKLRDFLLRGVGGVRTVHRVLTDRFGVFLANGSGRSRAGASLGDIAISPQTAQRNARRYRRPLDQELRVLVLHGTLHLLGYDHETDDGRMERVEARLRRRLGLD